VIHNNNRSGSNDDNGDGNSGHAVEPSESSGSSPPEPRKPTWTDEHRQEVIDFKLNFIKSVLNERDPGIHDPAPMPFRSRGC
jgi:hypothetical protein